MEQFLDLIQTPGVVVPVFSILVVIGALSIIFWAITRTNDLDTTLEVMEQERSRRLGERLERFYATGEFDPEVRMGDLARGSDVPVNNRDCVQVQNTPYADIAERYGLDCYKNHHRGELVFVDTRLEAYDIKKRVVAYPITKVVHMKPETLRKTLGSFRAKLNHSARAAGLDVPLAQRGRPRKEVVEHVKSN